MMVLQGTSAGLRRYYDRRSCGRFDSKLIYFLMCQDCLVEKGRFLEKTSASLLISYPATRNQLCILRTLIPCIRTKALLPYTIPIILQPLRRKCTSNTIIGLPRAAIRLENYILVSFHFIDAPTSQLNYLLSPKLCLSKNKRSFDNSPTPS